MRIVQFIIFLSNSRREVRFIVEPFADVIMSALARRSILVGGGAPPVQDNRRRRAWAANIFSKIPEKTSFYLQNFLITFFGHRKMQQNN